MRGWLDRSASLLVARFPPHAGQARNVLNVRRGAMTTRPRALPTVAPEPEAELIGGHD